MALLKSIINWMSIKRMNEINLFRKYPADVQNDELQALIKQATNTEWGKQYDYKSITNYETFKERIPIQTYEEIKPYVERIRQGEKNLLWQGDIKWFAKSSGTTNDKSKFIPISKETIENCHFRGGKDVLSFNEILYPNNKIFRGKGLIIGGSHKINNFNNESYFGDLSAILIENMPFYADFLRTPKSSIALMEDWEKKLQQMAETTIKQNVTNISGVPSWTLVLIKYILELTGKDNILDIWPNLELFIHGGVSFTPYIEQYKEIIPKTDMHYIETYNASEGFFGIQDEITDNSMLLMLDYGIFYEFIPMSEFDKPNPKTLMIDEVEIGVNYAIVITTNSGLWRYIIGDTIKFTHKYPHRFKITGRTKHFINAFGEELIVDNTDKALQVTCKKTNATIHEYTVAPIYMDNNQQGGHEWLIEFEKQPQDIKYFTYLLDEALKNINSDYESKRFNDYTLTLPKVIIAKKGTFHNWLHSRSKMGGQNKIPRLANNRDYLDDILNCIKE